MPKRKRLTWSDHEVFLEYLVDHSVKQASLKFGITEGAIRNRLYLIRIRLGEEITAINKIKRLQRISDRVKKLTTSGSIVDSEMSEIEIKD